MSKRNKRKCRHRPDGTPGTPPAFIEIQENTYVRAIWFCELEHSNVLGWMLRHPGEEWNIGYRFRHYRDRKAFNSDDEKAGYTIKPSTPGEPTDAELAVIADALDTVFRLMTERERITYPQAYWQKLDIDAVGLVANAMIQGQSWANMYAPGMSDTKPKAPGQA